MKKFQIIIFAAVAVLSFAGTFTVTWFIKKSRPATSNIAAPQARDTTDSTVDSFGYAIDIETTGKLTQNQTFGKNDDLEKSMAEKKLQSLIHDIIERKKDYKYKQIELEQLEERIKIASETLHKDINRLNTLRNQLANAIATLKQQQQDLKKNIFEINTLETANMQRLAARYDQMDTKQAAKIMINMNKNNQLNDIVKLIYYMTERKSAKLLGEISKTEPILVSALNDRLKRVKESK